MASVLPIRANTNSASTSGSTTSRNHGGSLSSFPSSKRSESSQEDSTHLSTTQHQHSHSSTSNQSSSHSHQSLPSINPPKSRSQNGSGAINSHPLPSATTAASSAGGRFRSKPVRSQYPPDSTEKHVEYILVASFDIDRGSMMEHQYPGPVGGDEHMLAELMLPDQAHVRAQDWTVFFLHKDAAV